LLSVRRGGVFLALLGVDEVFAVVLGTGANVTECAETWSRGGVGVDIDDLASLNVLEKSHSSVSCVVLHHVAVGLAFSNVEGRVLEDASLAVSALRRMVQEILADRGEVLTGQALFLLELLLAMSEAAALFLLTVFALLAVEPEAAQLGFDLLLPAILHLGSGACIVVVDHGGQGVVHAR